MSDTKKLFKNVVTKLNEIIEKGEEVVTESGEVIRKEAAPAYFAQALNLLKHVGETGADARPTIKQQLKELALPFSSPDDTDLPGVRH